MYKSYPNCEIKFNFKTRSNNQHHPIEIEIPVTVIEQFDQLNTNLKNSRESIANIDHKTGRIFLSLNADGKIVAKQGSKNAVSEMEIIENKNAINIEQLGLSVQYIEVPPKVEMAYVKAKNARIMESVRLISAGHGLLTGREYHKLNKSVPTKEWEKVNSLFEDFGTGGSGLHGWLTGTPEEVQRIIGLKPTEGKREHDDGIK